MSEVAFGTIAMTERGGERWDLRLEADGAVFVPAGGEAIAVPHEVFAKNCQLFRGARQWSIVTKITGRSKTFIFAPDDGQMLEPWMASRIDAHVAGALERRVRFGLPIALFIIATSLPVAGFHLLPLSLGIGVALLVLTALGRWRPRPGLFFFDAVIWVGFAANNMTSFGKMTTWSTIMVIASVTFSIQAFREFQFYRGLAASK